MGGFWCGLDGLGSCEASGGMHCFGGNFGGFRCGLDGLGGCEVSGGMSAVSVVIPGKSESVVSCADVAFSLAKVGLEVEFENSFLSPSLVINNTLASFLGVPGTCLVSTLAVYPTVVSWGAPPGSNKSCKSFPSLPSTELMSPIPPRS